MMIVIDDSDEDGSIDDRIMIEIHGLFYSHQYYSLQLFRHSTYQACLRQRVLRLAEYVCHLYDDSDNRCYDNSGNRCDSSSDNVRDSGDNICDSAYDNDDNRYDSGDLTINIGIIILTIMNPPT